MFIEDKGQTIAGLVGSKCSDSNPAIIAHGMCYQLEEHFTPTGFGIVRDRPLYKHFTPTGSLRCVVLITALLSLAFCLLPPARASYVGDFLGRRVTRVDVVIEGAPNANVTEIRTLLDVAAG